MVRNELSKRNPYWLPKHRLLELRHFCLQYDDIRRQIRILDDTILRASYIQERVQTSVSSDDISRLAVMRSSLTSKLYAIEHAAEIVGDDLSGYLLKAVTLGMSYETLRTKYNIPCCRNSFFDLYHKYFYELDKIRE